MTTRFVKSIEAFIQREGLELVRFKKGQRKDDVLQQKLRRFKKAEGVLFVGVAQEKVRVPRTTRKALPGGGTIPWIIYSTAMVNVYYFYCRDQHFGPFFLKFCSYFPYSAKLCLNGHEYLKCQLAQRGIAFQAMDNGLLSCADLKAAQRISDGLSDAKIDAFFRKWLARLPHPYSPKDRQAGYRYDLSVLQAEFSLTQLWDRLTHGRCFFEAAIRENIDLGRPEQGLIERIPKTQRYRLTTCGLKTALFYSRTYQRLLRPGLSQLHDPRNSQSSILAVDFAKFQKTLDSYITQKLAACNLLCLQQVLQFKDSSGVPA